MNNTEIQNIGLFEQMAARVIKEIHDCNKINRGDESLFSAIMTLAFIDLKNAGAIATWAPADRLPEKEDYYLVEGQGCVPVEVRWFDLICGFNTSDGFKAVRWMVIPPPAAEASE